MKNVKKYLSTMLALALALPMFTGCNNGLDEYPSDAQIPAPSDKFTTDIQFVSRLSDASLCASEEDCRAVHDYIVTTLNGKNGSWLTILDRADNGKLSEMLGTAFDSYRWTTFAFNRIVDKTSYQGSMLYVNQCLTESKGVPCGAGCYVTGLTTGMTGVRTDKNDLGEVTGTTAVSFDVNVVTARFDTADQIAAFGGSEGVLRSFYNDNMPFLMIGTVKNDLFGSLQGIGQSVGTSYGFNVFEVAKGGAIYDLPADRGAFLGAERCPEGDPDRRHRELCHQGDVVAPRAGTARGGTAKVPPLFVWHHDQLVRDFFRIACCRRAVALPWRGGRGVSARRRATTV